MSYRGNPDRQGPLTVPRQAWRVMLFQSVGTGCSRTLPNDLLITSQGVTSPYGDMYILVPPAPQPPKPRWLMR